jgi:hypothetical protein
MKTRNWFFTLAIGLLLQGNAFAQHDATVTAPAVPAIPPAANVPAPNATPIAGGGSFSFEEETHNFGDLEQGGDASWVFKFKNTGTEAITISLAKGSCGCTVPTWPKEPIAPGESAEIAVKYDSNRLGLIDKFVSIISNANETEKKIFIKGNILPKPEAPTFAAPKVAPEN